MDEVQLTCADVLGLLPRYVDPDPEERRSMVRSTKHGIRAHLDVCESCRDAEIALKATAALKVAAALKAAAGEVGDGDK